MNNRLVKTIGITLFTFAFISLLIYIIYCYGYYDLEQEDSLIEKYNLKKYDDIYQNLVNDDNLTLDEYSIVITNMFDETQLEKIYNTYYQYKDIFSSKDDFISTYYFGENQITSDDITFKKDGKTTLFTRSKIMYDNINITSRNGLKSSIGINSNLIITIEQNSLLKIDNKTIECHENECNIKSIFKGIHEINYTSNGYTYYGLLNITDQEIIDITNNDTLVTIDANNTSQKIQKGYYYLKECYLDSSCPSTKSSFIHIIDDKNIELKTYITLDQAGDYYKGTYIINNGFLKMQFSDHIYSVFDYDTKASTDISTKVDMEILYKIVNSDGLQNDMYYFKYSYE